MKKSNLSLVISVGLLSVVAIGWMHASKSQSKPNKEIKPLIFATEATYPPFVSTQANGKMVGFGVDVVMAVCKQMHQQCQLVNSPFDSLIPSLQLGKYDALFGGLGITSQRQKVVKFTKPYYNNSVVYVVNKSSQLDPNKLQGKTVGVQSGTQFQAYLQGTYGGKITIKNYASNMTALMDLKSGRIDAVLIDQPVAVTWLKSPGNQQFTTIGNIHDQKYFGLGNGIAVNIHNEALTP